jgi:hypothetical protein
MENFAEVKKRILNHNIEKRVNEDMIKQVKACDNWEQLKVVIADNINLFRLYNISIPDGYYKSNKYEFTLVNYQLHGEYKSWHVNGQPFIHCTYKDGELDGESKLWWWDDGKLSEYYIYKDGVRYSPIHEKLDDLKAVILPQLHVDSEAYQYMKNKLEEIENIVNLTK